MTIDERISSELRRHAPEVDEHAAWERFQSAAPSPARGRAMRLVPAAAAVLGAVLLGLAMFLAVPWDPAPIANLQSPFRGTWFTIDSDGSTVTMTVEVSGEGVVEITALDDFASVCSGAPSTMTGSGRLESETVLVIPAPVLTCDDGTEAQALSGPPPEELLRDLSFVIDTENETVTDSLGSVWSRDRVEQPDPDPSVASGMWPQSSLAEVEEAQELADADDPDYTWQLDPDIAEGNNPNAEIVARFIREELGWESFLFNQWVGWEQATSNLTYVRCAPGETNPLYPDDEYASRCAPTIDEQQYETVSIDLAQPGRQGTSGIWVVADWTSGQFRQEVPRSDAGVANFLDRFLQARVDGNGAEEQVDPSSEPIQLLYAASNGAHYEQFDYEANPRWPNGEFDVTTRMYADGRNTQVEQQFTLTDDAGRLLLQFRPRSTVENGQPLPEPYEIFGGEVAFRVPAPWYGFFDYGPNTIALIYPDSEDLAVLGVLPDPLPLEAGCAPGLAPADAEALARSILADPDLEATEPVAVRVGGVEGLQIDVVSTAEATVCDSGSPEVLKVAGSGDEFGGLWLDPGYRMRLLLLTLPEGSSARTLAVTLVASETELEALWQDITPVLDSFEFHTG
jgi:hypothetical protein